MVPRTLWLWLCIGWLTEAVINPSTTSICDRSGPCKCTVGKLTCDCSTSFLKEVLLKEELLDIFSFSSISITNCFHVHVAAKAISSLPAMQQVSVANVKQLTLEEQAFSWNTNNPQHTGLVINITNCFIQEIPSYSFQGSLRDIVLFSVNISRIRSYAFAGIDRADKLEFNRVNIKEIETQSFKRCSLEFLTVSDSYFGVLPEKTMMDMAVHQEVRLNKVKIDKLEKFALKVHSTRNFRLIKSTIAYTDSNAFDVQTKGDVSIHDNVFSHLKRNAFAGFSVEEKYLKEAGKQDFVFENNTLIQFENDSLRLDTAGFDPRLDWVMIRQKCSCDNAKLWTEHLVTPSSNPLTKGTNLQLDKLLFCLNPKPTSVGDFQRLSCDVTKISVVLTIIAVIVVILLVSVICLVVYCGVKTRAKRYINVPTSASALRPAEVNKAHMLVVPDGKTYRETELHVIVENVEPIVSTDFVKGRPYKRTND